LNSPKTQPTKNSQSQPLDPVPAPQVQEQEEDQTAGGRAEGQIVPGLQADLQEKGAAGAHLEAPGLQAPGHGLAAAQGQEKDRHQQGQVAPQPLQETALLP